MWNPFKIYIKIPTLSIFFFFFVLHIAAISTVWKNESILYYLFIYFYYLFILVLFIYLFFFSFYDFCFYYFYSFIL